MTLLAEKWHEHDRNVGPWKKAFADSDYRDRARMDLKAAFGYGLMVALAVAYLDKMAGTDLTGQLMARPMAGVQMVEPGLPGHGRMP